MSITNHWLFILLPNIYSVLFSHYYSVMLFYTRKHWPAHWIEWRHLDEHGCVCPLDILDISLKFNNSISFTEETWLVLIHTPTILEKRLFVCVFLAELHLPKNDSSYQLNLNNCFNIACASNLPVLNDCICEKSLCYLLDSCSQFIVISFHCEDQLWLPLKSPASLFSSVDLILKK